ncbi:copia LTR rider [Tanacetum coccineum]
MCRLNIVIFALTVWTKLKTLYMTNSLAKKVYLKKKLYKFYMPVGQNIFKHIDEFNKIILDLANVEVKFKNEDIALLLLTSLPASYEHFYGYLALWTGSFKLGGRDGHTKLKGNERKEHLNCQKNNRKKKTGFVMKDDQPSSSGWICGSSEVMMVMSAKALFDWTMDSRVSYRMTPMLDLFLDFLECDRGRVLLGDKKECKIREGYTVKWKSGKVKVINGSKVVLPGTRRDNCVYSLNGMQVLEKQELFGKKSLGKLDVYENRVLRKSHRVSFGVGRKVWVYILWFKHEAFGKFKEWKQLVENQTGRTVKKLRVDNGLAFYNRELEQLCTESGIARHLTVVNTPQQNLVAKRMNKTLIDKERTPKEMRSGHLGDYGMLRVFGCVTYSHIKQGTWSLMKGVMYKGTLKDYGAGINKSVEEAVEEL